jgi:hypothetical protein
MLLNAREDSITESLLSNNDVTAYETTGNTYDYAIEESILESDQPLPRAEYVTLSEGDGQLLGEEVVIIGPHEGRTVVSEDTWNDRELGRAGQFIPEDELTDDDICLPKPTTDRSSLQDNDAFWKWLDSRFAEMYEQKVEEYRELLKKSDDSMKALQEMNASTVASMKEGLNAR